MLLTLLVLLALLLALGVPVAFALAGAALAAALLGAGLGAFDLVYLQAFPNRLFGIMGNETLLAVPLFVFMGVMLERARIAEELLSSMARLFGGLRGGMALSVLAVGALMAASTGIVGATVVTMGLISLPAMLARGYDPKLAAGTVAAAGTLGQIIPPSIVLVLLGDQLSAAYQQAQLRQGVFAPETVSIGDLFAGALLPGLMLVVLYALYVGMVAWFRPQRAPAESGRAGWRAWLEALRLALTPIALIVAVLGSIILGLATPTEAAAVGAVGATLAGWLRGRFSLAVLKAVAEETVMVSAMVFAILIGATLFSLVFRGFGGDETVHTLLSALPGGAIGALIAVMLLMFLLGFVLDFIEIVFVVVPVAAPVLLAMGVDPIWLGVLMAVNLQTSFLTPPFGFALFYLRGVAPAELATAAIWRGAMPYVGLQLLLLCLLILFPPLVTFLPSLLR
ncbi:MAG: C4-dicarboxylate ABC transporter [Lysobacterales bacterium]|jgi:tripartite ATP-independent transporter DctM subunit|nr:MAG: C4-dicarboxylate ABC transporter [Xanthomonadales bacterium]